MSDGVCYAVPISLPELASPLLGGGGNNGGLSSSSRDRDTQLFFGFCCDMRRAAFIANIFSLIYSALCAVSLFIAAIHHGKRHHDHESTGHVVGVIIFMLLLSVMFLVFPILGLVGSIKFNAPMVIAATFWYTTITIVFLIQMEPVGAIILLIFYVYPHSILSYELQTELMTESNYSSEVEHSCCCV